MTGPVAGGDTTLPALELSGIHKDFGTFQALKNIELTVNRGEFVCFLGPSGCGKTTLLRIIAGLEVQTSGTIRQGGRDISRLPPAIHQSIRHIVEYAEIRKQRIRLEHNAVVAIRRRQS